MLQINEEKCANIFENDYLKRIEDANIIKEIIEDTKKGLVIALTAEWGNGKTWFIDNMRKLLEKESYKTVMYNAWEYELVQDPLNSFFSTIHSFLLENCDEYKSTDIKEQLLEAFISISKMFLPMITKLLFGKAIDISSLGEAKESFQEGLSSLIEENINQLAKKKDSIEKFKEIMNTYFRRVYPEGNEKKLVIFIDELDRCSPEYLVSFLEMIKHFFRIDNACFVIAIDKEQVDYSINHRFGKIRDKNAYLRKIIDLQYNIQPRDISEIEKIVLNIVYKHFSDKRISSFYNGANRQLINAIIHDMNLSIRDIERFFIFLDLLVENRAIGGLLIENNFPMAVFILIVKMKKEALFEAIYAKISPTEFYNIMKDDVLFRNLLKNTDFKELILKDLMVFLNPDSISFQHSIGLVKTGQYPTTIQDDEQLKGHYEYNSRFMAQILKSYRNMDLTF